MREVMPTPLGSHPLPATGFPGSGQREAVPPLDHGLDDPTITDRLTEPADGHLDA